MESQEARDRAEAQFKKTENLARDGEAAMAEYNQVLCKVRAQWHRMAEQLRPKLPRSWTRRTCGYL